MKKLVKNVTRKVLMTGLVLTVVLSACVLSHAVKSVDNHFWCSGRYVGYNDSMTSSKVTATTGFTDTINGQRTGVNVNTVIKDSAGRTKDGTAVHQESTRRVSGSYTCPTGYTAKSASIKHTAQVNGDTASKSVSLN